MSKSVWMSAAAIVLLAAGAILLPAPGQRVAAQSPGMFVNAVDLDIVPAERDTDSAFVRVLNWSLEG